MPDKEIQELQGGTVSVVESQEQSWACGYYEL